MGQLVMVLEAGAAAGSEVKGGMDAILTSVDTVVTAIGTVFTAMTSNPYLTFLLASSVLGVAINKFSHLKAAA